jgi:hypothetical protein
MPTAALGPDQIPRSDNIIECVNYYGAKHAKPADPFRQTVMFKSIAVGAAITVSAGVAAAGGAVATYYHHATAGPAYALADLDHADPYHSEPGGEWIRVESPESGGTAVTMHPNLGPTG